MDMDYSITQQIIDRYQGLIKIATDEHQRRSLIRLLADELWESDPSRRVAAGLSISRN